MEGGPPVQVVELHQGGGQGDALVEVSLLHVGDSSLRPPAGGEISDIPNLSLSTCWRRSTVSAGSSSEEVWPAESDSSPQVGPLIPGT